ncbi:MAG: hypothetical protein U9R56_07460 [candidate division Zixibacteria bacterium]|nr:hypothetical protein [candidate division Zixibacteria bacterium]
MSKSKTTNVDPDEYVERCLSMVLHYEEVQQMAAIIKKLHAERTEATGQVTNEAGDDGSTED